VGFLFSFKVEKKIGQILMHSKMLKFSLVFVFFVSPTGTAFAVSTVVEIVVALRDLVVSLFIRFCFLRLTDRHCVCGEHRG
jgi:hypothetical protein